MVGLRTTPWRRPDARVIRGGPIPARHFVELAKDSSELAMWFAQRLQEINGHRSDPTFRRRPGGRARLGSPAIKRGGFEGALANADRFDSASAASRMPTQPSASVDSAVVGDRI